MPRLFQHLAWVLVLAAAGLPWATEGRPSNPPGGEERTRARQVLNRLTFGARPGDVDELAAMGVDRWLDRQLHPEAIADQELQRRLAPLRTLEMSRAELIENFPPPAVIRQVADGRQRLPRDRTERAIYEDQLVRYRLKREQGVGNNPELQIETSSGVEEKISSLIELPVEERAESLFEISPEERVQLFGALKGESRERFLRGMSRDRREMVLAMDHPQQVVRQELVEAKILRAVYGERQLEEVMTDFWMNHFNVFIGKGSEPYELTSYEQHVIRPHALGKFQDLLVETAKSPAMLFYLDNWLSVGPHSEFATGMGRDARRKRVGRRSRAQLSKGRATGLNENYGRELMELHTLGVNGGYTQQDVSEVAKVFTGWTLEQPRKGGGFIFEEGKHEPGTKTVLGHKIRENGVKEGEQVLGILARHPATARFLSTKLAIRFVSDDPPPQLVERMAKTFLKRDGDIREVLKTMISSPEFWAPEAVAAKVKTPLEFVVSALRATGAEVTDASGLERQLERLGMPLYGAQPPTGYAMKASAWVSSSALLGRMNFAIRLASGKIPGVQPAPIEIPPGEDRTDPAAVLRRLEKSILEGGVSPATHETISAQLADPKISQRRLDDPPRLPDLAMIEALLIGAPEFQKR